MSELSPHSTVLLRRFPTRSPLPPPRLSRRPSNIHHRRAAAAGKRAIIREAAAAPVAARSIVTMSSPIPTPSWLSPLPPRTCRRRQCRGRPPLPALHPRPCRRPRRRLPPCRAHHRMTHLRISRRTTRIPRCRRRPPTTISLISSIRQAFCPISPCSNVPLS